MARTLVIGDIHNAYLALKQAIDRANIQTDDTLIFLGDYVDGWSQAVETIDYLIELKKIYNCIFIVGNHDYEWAEPFVNYGTYQKIWEERGGLTTIDSYRNHIYNNTVDMDAHRNFFNKMDYYYIDDNNRLFVHAGFVDERGAQYDNKFNLYWDRYLFGDAFVAKRTGGKKPKKLNLYNEIYVGHTTTLCFSGKPEPLNCFNIWNMDTGAGSNGKVTIMDVDTKEYWQSDLCPSLYPDDPHLAFCRKHS